MQNRVAAVETALSDVQVLETMRPSSMTELKAADLFGFGSMAND
jgi:hypothetical protein